MNSLSRMHDAFRGHLAALAASLLLLACSGGSEPAALSASAQAGGQATALAVPVPTVNASVLGLTKISETRVGRTLFDYVFRITVQGGSEALPGATAHINAAGPGTTVIEGDVQIGNLAAGATVTPTDTITLRQDRLLAFQPALLVWRIAGSGSAPASIELGVVQRVVGAGAGVGLLVTVRDAAGAAITPAPAVSYEVLVPPEGTSGTVPSVNAGQLITAASTRGSFTVRSTVTGTNLTASARVTVVQSLAQSGNSGLHATLSAAQGEMERQLAVAAAATQAGDAAALAAARAAIVAAAATVDPDRMSFTTAYAPDLGFVPTTAKLSANGILPTAADASYGTATALLQSKLIQVTGLLKQPSGDDAADSALLAQYRTELAAIVGTLQSAAVQPSLYGVVQHADMVSNMLALQMPQVLKAMALRVAAQIPAARQDTRRGAVPPDPAFITGLLDALGPMGRLINAIYGDYLNQIENMAIILGVKDLLDAKLLQTVQLQGVLSGAALLGPYAYHYPNSYIDLAGITVAAAESADVFLIGGAAVNALAAAGQALPPPSDPKSLQDVFDYFDGILKAIRGVGQAYQDAHQQPDFVIANSFDNFGCLPSVSDNCIEMHYNNGFGNVSGGSVSFTVLMLIRTGGPRPQYGSRVFAFAPNT
jgi:hypothetical protein